MKETVNTLLYKQQTKIIDSYLLCCFMESIEFKRKRELIVIYNQIKEALNEKSIH